MSQKLSVNGFKWVGDITEFDESFIKSCNGENDERYFLEVDIQHSENIFTKIYHFCMKEWK